MTGVSLSLQAGLTGPRSGHDDVRSPRWKFRLPSNQAVAQTSVSSAGAELAVSPKSEGRVEPGGVRRRALARVPVMFPPPGTSDKPIIHPAGSSVEFDQFLEGEGGRGRWLLS